MSERYTRLFSLPENLGQDGCPVSISAGALLKDNNTGKLLVQLKLRNISEQIIKSVKIKVNAYDTKGGSLKGVEDFSYLDLNVKRGGEFGSHMPVLIPDKTTRSVSVEILSVVYGSGEIYRSGNNAVAGFVDSVTQKIQLLNEARNEKNEITLRRKKTTVLAFLAFIPVIIDIFAIIIGDFRFYSRYCRPLILLSFFAPCLCLLSCWLKKYTFLKISLIVSAVCILIQLSSTLISNYVYFHGANNAFLFHCYRYIRSWIGGTGLLFRVVRFVKFAPGGEFMLFADFCFFAKNICAIIITSLQLKVVKKNVAGKR